MWASYVDHWNHIQIRCAEISYMDRALTIGDFIMEIEI